MEYLWSLRGKHYFRKTTLLVDIASYHTISLVDRCAITDRCCGKCGSPSGSSKTKPLYQNTHHKYGSEACAGIGTWLKTTSGLFVKAWETVTAHFIPHLWRFLSRPLTVQISYFLLQLFFFLLFFFFQKSNSRKNFCLKNKGCKTGPECLFLTMGLLSTQKNKHICRQSWAQGMLMPKQYKITIILAKTSFFQVISYPYICSSLCNAK